MAQTENDSGLTQASEHPRISTLCLPTSRPNMVEALSISESALWLLPTEVLCVIIEACDNVTATCLALTCNKFKAIEEKIYRQRIGDHSPKRAVLSIIERDLPRLHHCYDCGILYDWQRRNTEAEPWYGCPRALSHPYNNRRNGWLNTEWFDPRSLDYQWSLYLPREIKDLVLRYHELGSEYGIPACTLDKEEGDCDLPNFEDTYKVSKFRVSRGHLVAKETTLMRVSDLEGSPELTKLGCRHYDFDTWYIEERLFGKEEWLFGRRSRRVDDSYQGRHPVEFATCNEERRVETCRLCATEIRITATRVPTKINMNRMACNRTFPAEYGAREDPVFTEALRFEVEVEVWKDFGRRSVHTARLPEEDYHFEPTTEEFEERWEVAWEYHKYGTQPPQSPYAYWEVAGYSIEAKFEAGVSGA